MEDQTENTEKLKLKIESLQNKLAEYEKPVKPPHDNKVNLMEQDTRLKDTFDSLHDGVIVLDRNFHYIYWNRAMANITGLSGKQVLGLNKVAWEIFPHLVEQGVDKMMRRAMRGEVVQRKNIPFSLPGGKTGFTNEILMPLRSEDEKIYGVRCCAGCDRADPNGKGPGIHLCHFGSGSVHQQPG